MTTKAKAVKNKPATAKRTKRKAGGRPFAKGQSGNPGGRPKGAKNKLTTDVKQMILAALDKAGGEKYLLQQAQENPTAFMTLVGKCLPKEVTGPDGAELFPQKITIECVKARG